MQIKDIAKLHVDHITIDREAITCEHCGEKSFGLEHAETFYNHLYLIRGFVAAHKDCKKQAQ